MNNELSVYDLLMIDIETVPQYPEYAQLPDVWKSLWIDKISKTVPENISPEDSYLQRAGILAEFGKVICISTGYFLQDENKILSLRLKSIFGNDEKLLLQAFIDIMNKLHKHNKNFQFAGHNIREFDIPYLCRRMLINKIALPSYLNLHGAKPWEVRMIDTLQWWKFGDYKSFTSLELLAHILNIPTPKDDIDGSRVFEVYWKDGNLSRIAEYCQKDVRTLAQVFLRLNVESPVKEENIDIK